MVVQTGKTGQPTVWVGWVICAVAAMVIIGISHVIAGLVALLDEESFQVGRGGLLVDADSTVWGWVHIIVGVLIAVAGVALLLGRLWARVLAVVVASASVVVNLGFFAASPAWSATVIAFDLLVIYAVTAHGLELQGHYATKDPDAERHAR